MAKKSNDKVMQFLSSPQKLSELKREELADLLEDMPEDHWLRQLVIAELQKQIQ